jgi:hypothetical protein
MRKIGLLALTAVMGCVLAFALVGCSSDEKIIRDGLTEQLNQFKDPDSELWQDVISSSGGDLSSMGLEAGDLISAWTEGFSFEVGEITVNGDTAEAKISITGKQLMPAVNSAGTKMTSDLERLQSMTSDEITLEMGRTILNELKASSPVTTEIMVPCSKSGNEWSETSSATNEYTRALLGS